MKRVALLLQILMMLLFAAPVLAQSAPTSSPEDTASAAPSAAELKAQIKAELEAELKAQLKDELSKEFEARLEAETDRKIKEMEERKAAEPPKEEAAKEEKKEQSLLTSLGNVFQLYGFLRLDIAYDTSRTDYGNWMLWTLPNKTFDRTDGTHVDYHNTNEISITPRLSRFGLKLKGQHIDKLKADVMGQVEIDFFGGDKKNAEWSAVPRWRHAWVGLDWGFVDLRAGQQSDIFSTLYPKTGDPGAGWFVGNVGGRRPMLSVNFKPKVAGKYTLWAQAAIARPGEVSGQDLDAIDKDKNGEISASEITGDGLNDGEDSGVPMVQWRLAFQGPLWTSKDFLLGVSGHYEQTELRRQLWDLTDLREHSKSYRTGGWSVNAELAVPILEAWNVRGEFFYGENLGGVFGGVGQTINKESLLGQGDPEAIKGMGFWVDTSIQPWELWGITLGYCSDRPDRDTLPKRDMALLEATRFSNQAAFAHTYFNFGKGFHWGLHYQYAWTDYKYVEDPDAFAETAGEQGVKSYSAVNHRTLTYFMYKF